MDYKTVNTLTPWQAQVFLIFVILMLADFAITAWGFLNWPAFIEANSFYAMFAAFPALFLNTILWAKVAAIAGILLITEWFNTRDTDTSFWHGGNLVCCTAATVMGVFLSIFLYTNLVILL